MTYDMSASKAGISCTLVIPTYGRGEVLGDTLENALRLDPRPNEILVVDQNEKTPKSVIELDKECDIIKVVKLKKPNLPAARNVALQEGKGRIIIFIDDDVIMPDNFVKQHLRVYKEKDGVVAVAGRVIEEGKLETYTKSRSDKVNKYDIFKEKFNSKVGRYISSFPGGNHSIIRKYALSMGGYDENYIGYALREESDLAVRILNRGDDIFYNGSAYLYHKKAEEGGCRINRERQAPNEWQVCFPSVYFLVKHFWPEGEFWKRYLVDNVRRYVLRKENIVRPWRVPYSAVCFLYATYIAFKLYFNRHTKSLE